MMREEQALRDYQMAAPPAQPAAEEKPPSTFFIYRDGRQLEVQNYAIVGNTLWVFSDQSTRRIPLADLNLIATRQFNEDRGVDFPLPDCALIPPLKVVTSDDLKVARLPNLSAF